MRLTARLVGLALAAVLAFALAAPPATLAAFTDRATASSPDVLATAGTLATPAAPTVGPTVTGRAEVSWQQTTAVGGAGAVPATGYQVFRYSGATGTAGQVQVCPTTPGLALDDAARRCTVDLPQGSYVSVVARFGTQWRQESARSTAPLALDLVGPTLVFTAPSNGEEAGAGPAFRNAVAPRCPASSVACGTVADPSAPVTVQYALTRRAFAAGVPTVPNGCWTESGWSGTVPTTGCALAPAVVSGGVWRVPGSLVAAYDGNEGAFVLRIRAVDGAGNATDRTITFGY
ncbi:hypothetical protein [Nocardioides perillae]|uniref:Uncharacterized protein n=1 Tax=Nocardioides perillae TaxID=1119534 RepID=A0A7Y9RVI7_9ACTN|nr:hypothetical protein [Nocardioides perillae]NYG56104.1 hypothetical protein [Nocardioides perillae]